MTSQATTTHRVFSLARKNRERAPAALGGPLGQLPGAVAWGGACAHQCLRRSGVIYFVPLGPHRASMASPDKSPSRSSVPGIRSFTYESPQMYHR